MSSINTILSTEKKIEKEIEKSKQYWENKFHLHIESLIKEYSNYKDLEEEKMRDKLNLEINKINSEQEKKLEEAQENIEKISFESYLNKLREIIAKEVIEN